MGEVLELDQVKRTGTVNEVWSRISYVDENGAEQTGYIPTSALDFPETIQTADAGIDKKLDAGDFQKAAEKVFLQKQWRQAEVSVKSMEYRWELRLQHPQMRT